MWHEIPLSKLVVLEYGRSLRKDLRNASGDIPVAGSNGVDGYHSEALVSGPGIVVGRKGSAGKVTWFESDFWPIDTTYYVKPRIPCDLRWVYYLLTYLSLDRLAITTGVPGLNRDDAYRVNIPLPALSEQRRIVEILDEADRLRRQRRETDAKVARILPALFHKTFGDPATNPMGWQRVRITDFCASEDDVKCGPFGTQLAKAEYSQNDGVPLWGIKHVNRQFEDRTDEFLTHDKARELDSYSLVPGDIVMTRKGTIGNCAVYRDTLPKGIMHSDLLRIRVHREIADPDFVCCQFRFSVDVARQLQLISGGAVMPGINVTKLKQIKLLRPPLDRQRAFGNVVRRLRRLSESQVTNRDSLDKTFDVLLHRAFTGELTAGWRQKHKAKLEAELAEQLKAIEAVKSSKAKKRRRKVKLDE
ncbi:MAG: hypothetical protein KatS3mg105_2205 [Gemmatales bacterium]|nr:MAG: hypothetical protein KatS3mg105_2205 [Gemmatales bacterium]